MSRVLVTGGSGFVGTRVIEQLATAGHYVISLSRAPVTGAHRELRGSFTSEDDLELLRGEDIEVAVHLAGVTGAASEADAIEVNVGGTRRLLRQLIDLGVTRFVIASSIAAVGCLSPEFMPESVPIADSHPCHSDNVYGVSKFFIEQLCSYFSRRDPELDFVLFRLGVVIAESTPEPEVAALHGIGQPFCELGTIAEADAVRAFVAAVEKCGSSGVRVLNLVAPVIRSPLNTVETLAIVLGDRVNELDLSFYSLPGNERAGLFDVRAIESEYASA